MESDSCSERVKKYFYSCLCSSSCSCSRSSTFKSFNSIRNELLTEIFLYLNLTNIRTVMVVNKRFKNLFLKNDSKLIKQIGQHTYGLHLYKNFEKNILADVEMKSIKSNLNPIEHLVLMNDLDLMATAAGKYDQGILIWRQSSGIYENDIKFKNLAGDRGFVNSLNYIEELNYLVVTYIDGELIVYIMNNQQNDKYRQKENGKINYVSNICWSKRLGNREEPVVKTLFLKSLKGKNLLITLEQSIENLINFIKIFDISNGSHISSATFSNSIITSFRLFNYKTFTHDIESYLTLGLSDGKILLKKFKLDELERNYSELINCSYLYGHESDVTDTLFIKDCNILISCAMDLYIFFWEMGNEKKKVLHYIDSFHDDIILNLCYLENKIFASSSKDRSIRLWNLTNYSNIACLNYNNSVVSCISFNKFSKELISAGYDKNIRCVKLDKDYKNISSIRIVNGHNSSVSSARLDYISKFFITASLDKTIKFWDLKKFEFVKSLETKNEYFDDFIILYDFNSISNLNDMNYSNIIIKVDLTKKIKCLDIYKGIINQSIDEVSTARSILNLNDAVSFLVGLSNSQISVYYYYINNITNSYVFKKKNFLIHAEESNPNSDTLKVGSSVRKNLKIKKLNYLDHSRKMVCSVADDGSICIFYLNNFTKNFIPAIRHSEVDCVCFVSHSFEYNIEKDIIAISILGEIYLFDLITRTFIFNIYIGKTSCIDKLNDKYLVLSSGESNYIQIFDTLELRIIRKIEVSYNNIKHLFYMKDGNRIVVTSGDNIKGFAMDIIKFTHEINLC